MLAGREVSQEPDGEQDDSLEDGGHKYLVAASGYEDHQDILPLVLYLVHRHDSPGPGEVVDVMENLDSSMNMAAPNTCPAL